MKAGMQFRPLKEQTIVITGASSGIGLATAKMAAKKGANIVISSRNGEELRRIAGELEKSGAGVLAVEADVQNWDEVVRLKNEAVSRFGRIDTWVNNAGASLYGSLFDAPEEEERAVFETNFWGLRHGCRVAVPELAKNGGVLINIGSEVSEVAIPVQGIYSASKHAVKAYTDSLRLEIEKEGMPVAVSLIRPAGIDTPFTEHAVNRLKEGEPSLPPPVYHPNLVAKAILSCAVAPQRDVFVGGASKFFSVMESFLPRVLDTFMEKLLFRQQSQGASHEHTEANEGLLHHPASEGKIRGGHQGVVLPFSAYTSATLHPWRTVAMIGIAALAIGGIYQVMEKWPERETGEAA